jgi:SAM-dependent methyltransferase
MRCLQYGTIWKEVTGKAHKEFSKGIRPAFNDLRQSGGHEMDTEGKYKVGKAQQSRDNTGSPVSRRLFLRRPPAILDPIRRLFEPPQRLIGPCVKKGQVVADLGCGSGYYTFALAEIVGTTGKVYAVDLDKKCVQALEKKACKVGYHNIEAHASSAADLSFINSRSVDFILANGLL